jgi:hypothetical protein
MSESRRDTIPIPQTRVSEPLSLSRNTYLVSMPQSRMTAGNLMEFSAVEPPFRQTYVEEQDSSLSASVIDLGCGCFEAEPRNRNLIS